jgi:glutaredoxin
MYKSIPLVLFCCLIHTQSAQAYGNYFDSLKTDEQLLRLDSVMNSFVVTECCDTTLGGCLTLKPDCSIAHRLYNFTSWLIMKNDSYKKCIEQLDKRYQSFFGPDTFSCSPSIIPSAGDTSSPVLITAYISASCPLCKKVCIPLHMAVTRNGPLFHIAKLSLKPIAAQSGDLALMAANAQGKFWEFFLALENEKRRLDEHILMKTAKHLGLDLETFEKHLYEQKYIKELNRFRQEAVDNGASITPTLFINNRRYQSYKDPQWVIDAVEYDYYERKTKE